MIRVVNKRTHRPTPHDVYIGRPSPLGNAHALRDERHRNAVIAAFRQDLRADWAKRGPMRAEIEALARRVLAGENLNLVCFCAPRACHGDVIKDAITACVTKKGA